MLCQRSSRTYWFFLKCQIFSLLPRIVHALYSLLVMRLFFWLCLLLLIPGLLARVSVGNAGLLPSDLLLPIFSGLWLAQKLFIERKIPMPKFLLPGLVFLAVALISFVLGAHDLAFKEQVLSFSYWIRFASLLIFGLAAADFYGNTREELIFFGTRIMWILGLVITLGLIQFYLIPDISTWSTEGGWDPHTGRLLGTWMDPNFIAGLLGFALPLLMGCWYETNNKKLLLSLLIIISVVALFLTFSRSGSLAAVIGLGIFFLLRDPKIIVLGILILSLGISLNERAQKRFIEFSGTVSSVLLQDTDEIDPTAKLRFKSWRDSFELYRKYPVMGIGFNTYRYKASEEGIVDENYFSAGGADSTLLTILVTTGTLGALAFVWIWWQLFLTHLQRFFYSKQNFRSINLGFSAGIASLLVHSLFVNSLLFPLILLPTFAISGVLDALNKKG